MKREFGVRSDGQMAYLYTITDGRIKAELTDHGATLARLFVPDRQGNVADVVLGFDHPDAYTASDTFFGATIGRNSNRVGGAGFTMNGKKYSMDANDNGVNNLHSGNAYYKNRMWQVESHDESSICFRLESPDGDQGFPGNAVIRVTYALENSDLRITYDAVCDQDTVFNLTNHSYFNLAGHDKPELSINQILQMNATFFNPDDAMSIPTGELRSVEGTPMDFRTPKAIGRDIGQDYDALNLQGGYDHNFEVKGEVCATVTDPVSGRVMEVLTDCPGIQFYCGNFLKDVPGKDGVIYCYRGGFCLETQYYPDSVNHPEWPQPFTKAGQPYHSQTIYRFK